MARNVEETKRRIIEAAAVEFGEHGIAGARVDRIVEQAGCGKGLIYNYFDSKDGLFDAVYDVLVAQTAEAVPFEATDLPGYAVALHDHLRRDPRVVRLTSWFELERGEAALPDAVVQSQQRKIDAITKAQADGVVNPGIPAADLLAALVALAMLDTSVRPDRATGIRRSVRESVARLSRVD